MSNPVDFILTPIVIKIAERYYPGAELTFVSPLSNEQLMTWRYKYDYFNSPFPRRALMFSQLDIDVLKGPIPDGSEDEFCTNVQLYLWWKQYKIYDKQRHDSLGQQQKPC